MIIAATGVLLVLLIMSCATAVVPLGPPEAMVVALTLVGTRSPGWALVVAAVAASGQAAGKLLVFLAVRGGLGRRCAIVDRLLGNRLLSRMASHDAKHPRHMAALVGVSALASVPPLTVVCPLAGTTTMRVRLFVLATFAGRLARFSVLALVPALLW
ncbi:MAG: hypothetical protein QOH80_75 [Actinomycetota bacterium]|nr:hypothetical protein [Actinomycetota bacterium]